MTRKPEIRVTLYYEDGTVETYEVLADEEELAVQCADRTKILADVTVESLPA